MKISQINKKREVFILARLGSVATQQLHCGVRHRQEVNSM